MKPEPGPLQKRFLSWKDGSMQTDPPKEIIRKFDEFAQEMEEVAHNWTELASLCRQAASTLREADM
jgi:hypothetical protein